MRTELAHPDKFVNRHIGPNDASIQEMLGQMGLDSVEQLIDETIPNAIRLNEPLQLPVPLSEHQLMERMTDLASQNKVMKSYIGMGYYGTIVPNVIKRNILENPGWYTQYTPYQAEIAQGRLEALLNFQTLVADLTGLPIANASLLDEGTAAAEAMTMAHGLTRKANLGDTILVHENTHPQTIAVLQTRAEPLDIKVRVEDLSDTSISEEHFALVVSYPGSNGSIHQYQELIKQAKAQGSIIIFVTDLLALTVLTPPGELHADIAVGSAQRLGVPMGWGGPHAAFFATKDDYKRLIPGRIVGMSIDAQGNPALRLALQTREQHIRREKATSNICTAQVLLAIMNSMYAVYHGPNGLKQIAERIYKLTLLLDKGLTAMGYRQANKVFFDTVNVYLADNAYQKAETLKRLSEAKGMNFRYTEDGNVCISLDETTNLDDVLEILEIFRNAGDKPSSSINIGQLLKELQSAWPESFVRTSHYLTHPVFNTYHTETDMMRYIKSLESKDLSLTFSMIPLGSCTMKLNAATELQALSMEGFSNLHPFAPIDQVKGYQNLIRDLGNWLATITGFAAVSFMPNSGAQGEYAGLLTIRSYLKAKGQGHRNIALIPASAHGTNPASAVMVGYSVVVVKTDEKGNIDIDDLREKAIKHKENLACLMITYPSTHGVFETGVKEICSIIHDCGGQVYMDGANMNAQVGLTSPGFIGADVCHLNLHKTFCIPHGGGGPGMGPIAVASHLSPYLPTHPITLNDPNAKAQLGPVSAAPYGSASILTISYAYIAMMGTEGLTRATQIAILNANYIKARLEGAFKVLYTGENGHVAHELLLDMREFKRTANIEVEDIAKRLMDYGFHAPTVSFPVPGTIMIEPTESESKAELDRFCDAMLAIRKEIQQIEDGLSAKDNNILVNAPHTLELLTADAWDRPYSRKQAAYPLSFVAERKFWPSVARVNNSHGDRNLICTCAPIEDYQLA